jgi:hypothetical protein
MGIEKIVKENGRLILVAAVILLFFSMQNANTLPKEATADLIGKTCTVAKVSDNCPCFGTIGNTSAGTAISSYGVGKGMCIDCGLAKNVNETACIIGGHTGYRCDMTWCYDMEPWAEWAKDKPFQWLKDNPIMTLGIIGLIVLIIFYK